MAYALQKRCSTAGLGAIGVGGLEPHEIILDFKLPSTDFFPRLVRLRSDSATLPKKSLSIQIPGAGLHLDEIYNYSLNVIFIHP